MNGKGHATMFLIFLGLFAIPWIYYLHLYIRVLIGIIFLPLLDPDFDLQLADNIHRWFLSHSIIPALVVWYCFEPAFNEYGKIIFVIFAFYPITHLIGDLKIAFDKKAYGGTWQICLVPRIRFGIIGSWIWYSMNIGFGIGIIAWVIL
jgi:hypothetical protein